jgi:flagellar hook-length control protein FliK
VPATPAGTPVQTSATQSGDAGEDGRQDHRSGDPLAGLMTDRRVGAVETPAQPSAIETIDRERIERLAEGLAVRLRASQASDGARIRMLLEPRELGEVVIRLDIRDGVAQAFMTAESHESAQALQAALGDLRTALADRGLNLERIDVRVAGEGGRNGSRDEAGSARDGQTADRLGHSAAIDEAPALLGVDENDPGTGGQTVWMLA